jgi:hypothetical protein
VVGLRKRHKNTIAGLTDNANDNMEQRVGCQAATPIALWVIADFLGLGPRPKRKAISGKLMACRL